MTLPQMISNLHVKKELLMFLHKKDIDTNYAIFFYSSDFGLAQMTSGQNYYTPSGDMQFCVK